MTMGQHAEPRRRLAGSAYADRALVGGDIGILAAIAMQAMTATALGV
jgi:hypothetical protein